MAYSEGFPSPEEVEVAGTETVSEPEFAEVPTIEASVPEGTAPDDEKVDQPEPEERVNE